MPIETRRRTARLRERRAPTATQIEHARGLLRAVPTLAFDWTSAEGRAFLSFVDTMTTAGVPAAWIADQLGVDPHRLYATLARHRKAEAS